MIMKLREGILIMESPDPRNTYVNFYIDYPERREERDQNYRSGFNVIAICSDRLEEDLRGLYIYYKGFYKYDNGNHEEILGVDIV